MSVECFIDTDLFLDQIENVDKPKNPVTGPIIGKGIKTKNACISFQVIQDCLNVLLGKALVPLSPPEADRCFVSVRDPGTIPFPGFTDVRGFTERRLPDLLRGRLESRPEIGCRQHSHIWLSPVPKHSFKRQSDR